MPAARPPVLDFPTLQRRIEEAGVVGMGGGGFPTHRKLRPRLHTVIINGAECEPLLATDRHLLANHLAEVVAGAGAVARTGGAAEVALAVKAKHADLARRLAPTADGVPLRLAALPDIYPSGDEFFVIRDVAGRVLPQRTIPADAGFFVGNAATFKAIHDALRGVPLTRRYVTVCGAVARPVTVEAAIGTPFRELAAAAGGATAPDVRYLEGGVLMGALTSLDAPVTKTTAALIALPADHPAILERTRPLRYSVKIAEDICCQCRKCTELCSRYLIGHDIEPHKLMRLIGSARDYRDLHSDTVFHCSGCGLCSLVACPFDLSPRRLIMESRRSFPRPAAPAGEPAGRADTGLFTVPTRRLIRHLRLDAYDRPAEFAGPLPVPAELRLPLRQHAGVAAEPAVRAGQRVTAAQAVGRIPAGALGAHVHAPAAGTVVRADDVVVIATAPPRARRSRGGDTA